MVNVRAESHVTEKRLGLDLVVVLDISGSMSGEKIQLAKDTCHFVIDNLQACDRLCIVVFDDVSEVLTNLTPLTDHHRARLHNCVRGIHSRGSTNIAAGLADAFDVLVHRRQVNALSAIFLLSDGQDTCGNSFESFTPFLQRQAERMAGRDFRIHSFGYGDGHDEKVLCAVSDFRKGNFYYIKNIQIVAECFAACLGILLSCFARQVRVELTPHPDAKL